VHLQLISCPVKRERTRDKGGSDAVLDGGALQLGLCYTISYRKVDLRGDCTLCTMTAVLVQDVASRGYLVVDRGSGRNEWLHVNRIVRLVPYEGAAVTPGRGQC